MNDLEKKIWAFIGKPQTAALATVTAAGTPWVRYVTIEADADFTLRFCTSLASRKTAQISASAEVHLVCGNLQPPDSSVYLQIAGRAEIRTDAATRARHWNEELRRYFSGPDDPDFVMIFIHPSLIEYTGPESPAAAIWHPRRSS